MGNPGSKFANFMKEPLKNSFEFFGHSPNGAVTIAVSIAAFKGLFRPIFTMHDKKSDHETKKYTAWREFLTEIIAIPVYIAIPELGKKLFVKKTDTKIIQKATETNVKFIGVLLATAIIPAVCNLIQPPIMKGLKKRGEAKKALLANNPIPTQDKPNKPSFSGNNPVTMKSSFKNNYGMRVGS